MKTSLIATLVAAASLSGCASLNQFTERHPVVTAVGATLIAGSIIATANANGLDPSPRQFDPNHGHKTCQQGGGC
jgi:hypothetical protein